MKPAKESATKGGLPQQMIALQVLQRHITHVTLLWPRFTKAGSIGLSHRWWIPAKACARLAGLMRAPSVSEVTEELTFAAESQGDRLRLSSAVVLTVGRHTAPANSCVIHRREEVLRMK